MKKLLWNIAGVIALILVSVAEDKEAKQREQKQKDREAIARGM